MAFKIIKENILRVNSNVAGRIKKNLDEKGVFMINMISSPGSGKTTLIKTMAPFLDEKGISFMVLAGDCFACEDARCLDKAGIKVIQINTGNACHIDAQLIHSAIGELDIEKIDLVIIENVGNIVCPAEFYLGEDSKIALLSVAEGHNKPLKYPLLFKESEAVIITKTDLLNYTDFDMAGCEKHVYDVNPGQKLFKTSSVTAQGIESFVDWLSERITAKNKTVFSKPR